jgi:hypothetical protein
MSFQEVLLLNLSFENISNIAYDTDHVLYNWKQNWN